MTTANITPRAMIGDIPVYCSHDELADIMTAVPNPKNPNTHPERQIKMLAQIIKSQGWRKPITVSNRSGFVVSGHGRLQAAFQLGMDKVPIDYQNYATEAEEHADLIADNRIAELSETDDELMAEILKDLEGTDIDMLLTGYDDEALEDLFSGFSITGEHEVEDDGYDAELPKEPKAKMGDIYQLGDHRLMCGDSTNADHVKTLMDGNRVDISFTSPPYNVGDNLGYEGKDSKYLNNDDDIEDYVKFLRDFTQNAMDHSEYTFVNIQQLANNKVDLITYVYEFRNKLADTIIWDKGNAAPAMVENVLNSVFEYVYVFSERATRAIGTRSFRGNIENIVRIGKQRNNEYHEIHNATFPLDFAAFFVENFSQNSVLDLFGGTGTTLIACEQLNRQCYTMEYEPMYVDVIIDRWEQLTGNKAELIHREEE